MTYKEELRRDFVEYYIFPLVQQMDEGITAVTYERDKATDEEYCYLEYPTLTVVIDITKESRRGILQEVLRCMPVYEKKGAEDGREKESAA